MSGASVRVRPGCWLKGLAVGLLLDTFVVRTLLVPSAISLFGRWNWWFPEPARRLLRVQPA